MIEAAKEFQKSIHNVASIVAGAIDLYLILCSRETTTIHISFNGPVIGDNQHRLLDSMIVSLERSGDPYRIVIQLHSYNSPYLLSDKKQIEQFVFLVKPEVYRLWAQSCLKERKLKEAGNAIK